MNLLIAKSKLAPTKKPLTIPRLELCGAVLAVKLLKTVSSSLRCNINKTFLWTDSSIVWSWIRGDPNRWTVFVSNRVHKILESTEIDQWNHVISQDNPADCNSRGLLVEQLSESNIWWNGPNWLSLSSDQWPKSQFNIVDDDPAELRSSFKSINVNVNEISPIDTILLRFNSFS